MKLRVNGRKRIIPVLPVLFMLAKTPSLCGADVDIQVIPDSIQIGTFFCGAQVKVSAEIPNGSEAVIEVLGNNIEEQLFRKGRYWVIWMRVGEIDSEGAPCLYFAMSTNPETLSQASADAPWGYKALQKRVSFLGDVKGMRGARIFEEFIKLKETEKLYGLFPGALKVSQASGGRSVLKGAFTIPSRVAPGTYEVRLSVIRNGRLLQSKSAPLGVRMVSLPALLSSLANEYSALYGLVAVVIAICFGFLTGVMFKRTKGSY
jgi:hypothetical protein